MSRRERQRDRETERQRQRERQRDRDRQRDRETERQRDRETDRERERENSLLTRKSTQVQFANPDLRKVVKRTRWSAHNLMRPQGQQLTAVSYKEMYGKFKIVPKMY